MALTKRPVSEEQIDKLIARVEAELLALNLARFPRMRLAKQCSTNCGTSTRSPTSGSPRSTASSPISKTSARGRDTLLDLKSAVTIREDEKAPGRRLIDRAFACRA